MQRLDRDSLLNLLATYETAIRELERWDDPLVTGLLRRLERHRAEVLSALATQYLGPEE